LESFALPVSDEYTSTKLVFGYKLLYDRSPSPFETRLVPERIWDNNMQGNRWCTDCGGSKLVAQSGWYPYHTWFKFCFQLFTRTHAFGMTPDLTRKVLAFLIWRKPDEHRAGLRAIEEEKEFANKPFNRSWAQYNRKLNGITYVISKDIDYVDHNQKA